MYLLLFLGTCILMIVAGWHDIARTQHITVSRTFRMSIARSNVSALLDNT